MIIEKVLGNITEYETGGRASEKIVMDREQLAKPHQKVKSETGEVYAISLEHGEGLKAGDVVFADEKRVVFIELMPEDALVIYPEGQLQWARAAYNIGNMHQGAYIKEDCIVSPYDAILEGLMGKLGVRCERAMCRLDGVRANAAQGHHHHHHSDHHHAHEHHHHNE